MIVTPWLHQVSDLWVQAGSWGSQPGARIPIPSLWTAGDEGEVTLFSKRPLSSLFKKLKSSVTYSKSHFLQLHSYEF